MCLTKIMPRRRYCFNCLYSDVIIVCVNCDVCMCVLETLFVGINKKIVVHDPRGGKLINLIKHISKQFHCTN